MKIQNKIKNIYIISFMMYLLLVIYGSFFVINFYQNTKMRSLEEFLNYQHNLSMNQIENYAVSHGFDIFRIEQEDNMMMGISHGSHVSDPVITHIEFDHANQQAIIYVTDLSSSENLITYLVRVNSVLIIEVTTIATSMLIVSSLIIFTVLNLLFRKTVTEIIKPLGHIQETLDMIKHFEFKNVSERENLITIEELYDIEETIKSVASQLNEYLDDRHLLTSALTHEIKSPVNSINSLLLGYQNDLVPFNDMEYILPLIMTRLDEIVDISEHALALFEQKEYQKANEFANPIIIGLIEKFKMEFRNKNLILEYNEATELFEFFGNEEVFEIVLSNLFTNISKYAKKDSRVIINITESEISFENELSNQYLSGTQKGLKLANELLKSMRLDLTYKKKRMKYIVTITRIKND